LDSVVVVVTVLNEKYQDDIIESGQLFFSSSDKKHAKNILSARGTLLKIFADHVVPYTNLCNP
jgi:hypothetical protein